MELQIIKKLISAIYNYNPEILNSLCLLKN